MFGYDENSWAPFLIVIGVALVLMIADEILAMVIHNMQIDQENQKVMRENLGMGPRLKL